MRKQKQEVKKYEYKYGGLDTRTAKATPLWCAKKKNA